MDGPSHYIFSFLDIFQFLNPDRILLLKIASFKPASTNITLQMYGLFSSFILLKTDFLTFLCFFRWQRTQCFVIWSFNSGKSLKSYNTLGQIWRFSRTGTSPCNSGRLHLLNWWTSLYWKDSSEYRSCLLRKGNFFLYTVLQMFRQVLFLAGNHSNHIHVT